MVREIRIVQLRIWLPGRRHQLMVLRANAGATAHGNGGGGGGDGASDDHGQLHGFAAMAARRSSLAGAARLGFLATSLEESEGPYGAALRALEHKLASPLVGAALAVSTTTERGGQATGELPTMGPAMTWLEPLGFNESREEGGNSESFPGLYTRYNLDRLEVELKPDCALLHALRAAAARLPLSENPSSSCGSINKMPYSAETRNMFR